ncbi:MAG: histidine phosphatase family protein [Spirochaetes bacterium]|uniref:Histidine phosphatase family protein n=1 Tax=Candidatus Ornithospirochaeta stercoripullorum TaxID=2840899 RepID=A0A9D9DZF9_9SPIO|nr:histidine phosphatase family protein [Candidatus Ornithospirochaeta stercoripullorum]
MKIFLVRHGETEWNAKRKVCGMLEADLSENGRMQAQLLADYIAKHKDELKIEAIYTSPLRRARETALPIEKALGLEATVEYDLHEVNFGEKDGTDWDDPEFKAFKAEPFKRFPGGESASDAVQRSYNLLDGLRRKHSGNILLVAHATIIRIMDTYFHSRTMEEYKAFRPANCQMIEYETTQLK